MFKQITHRELYQKIQDNADVLIADVRDIESYQAGHIPDAIHFSMDLFQQFCENARRRQSVVVYCFHGVTSQAVAQHLVDQGFSEVYSLKGGFEVWKEHYVSSASHNNDTHDPD